MAIGIKVKVSVNHEEFPPSCSRVISWAEKKIELKPKHLKIARTSFLSGLCDNLKNFPFEDEEEASLHDNLWVFLSDDNTIGVNRSLHHHLPLTFLATVYHSNSASKILLLQPSIQFFTVLWMVITKFQSSHDLLLCQFDCCCWSTIENFLTNFIALMVDACAREVVLLIDIKPIKIFVIWVYFSNLPNSINFSIKKSLRALEAWDCNQIMYYYGVCDMILFLKSTIATYFDFYEA